MAWIEVSNKELKEFLVGSVQDVKSQIAVRTYVQQAEAAKRECAAFKSSLTRAKRDFRLLFKQNEALKKEIKALKESKISEIEYQELKKNLAAVKIILTMDGEKG